MGEGTIFSVDCKEIADGELVGAEGLEGGCGVCSGAELLVFVLKLIELPVETAVAEEFLVGAALAELAFVHDEDLVSSLNS